MYFDFNTTDYFDYHEFSSPGDLCTGYKMKSSFMNQLVIARFLSKTPFIIYSGYRTVIHNKKVKGKSNSSHLTGNASDILYTNSSQCFEIITCLLRAGFTRIGINNGTIHVDNDPTKPKGVIFNYY